MIGFIWYALKLNLEFSCQRVAPDIRPIILPETGYPAKKIYIYL